MTGAPLTPGDLERLVADVQRCCVDTGCTCPAARLLAHVRSLTVERDAAREEAAWMKSERDKWRDFKPVTADLVDRLSRAREALAECLEARDCAIETERLSPREHRLNDALAALRAALAEPPGAE